MSQLSVLKKIEKNELTAYEAMDHLYPVKKVKPGKRAFFIKMSVRIPEEGKALNTFLRIIFAIPIPLIFARMGLRFAKRHLDEDGIDINEIARLLKYSKNTKISIESSDALVDIKIM